MSFFIAFQEKNIDSLGASRHDGIAKEGLTECGRLNKGYKFNMIGKIVKVEPKKKVLKNAQTPKKPSNKVIKNVVENKKNDSKIVIKTNNKVVRNSIRSVANKKDYGNPHGFPRIKNKNIISIEDNQFEKKYNISLSKFLEVYNNSSKQLFVHDIYETVSINPIDRDKIDWNEFFILFATECYNQKLTIKNKFFLDSQTYKFDTKNLVARNPVLLKKSGFESFKNIVSKDNLRPAMQGVYCEKDMFVGTDAHKIILIKSKIEEKNIGKILNINSKEIAYKSFIDNKFPDYKPFFNDLIFTKENSIDVLDLIKEVQNFVNATKILAYTPIYTLLPTSGNYEFNFNSFFLLDTLLCLEANGTKLINLFCTDYNKIIIETDNGNRALIMAMNTAVYGQNKNVLVQNSNPRKIVEIQQGLNAPNTNAGSNQVGLFGILEVSTEQFKKMTVTELRNFTLKYYNENLNGNKVEIKKHLREVTFTTNAGRKIAKGGAMYKEKASIIEHLETIIKNSTYNNWGNRKDKDSIDVLGYLNFKSKITIDNEKKHVRIAIVVKSDRKTLLKNFDIGNKKKVLIPQVVKTLPAVGGLKPISIYKNNNNNTKNNNSGLNFFVNENLPVIAPIKTAGAINKNSLAYRMANISKNVKYFNVANPQINKFLGKIEIKTHESVFISLTGGQGSMKTRMAFQFMNAFAQNYKVGHASIEEHPESSLYYDKANEYLNDRAMQNIENPEIRTIQELHELIERNDVIVIDSFTKLKEIYKSFEVDKDLRKKYNGKLFIVIFQQTTTGAMRGGSKSQFDADIVLFTKKFDNYFKNYIYADKNRYSIDSGLQYNIFERKLQGLTEILPETTTILKFKVD